MQRSVGGGMGALVSDNLEIAEFRGGGGWSWPNEGRSEVFIPQVV